MLCRHCTSVVEEGVALLTAPGVAECSLFDAPPQSDPSGVPDYQGLGRWEVGGYLGIPEEGKGFIVYNFMNV